MFRKKSDFNFMDFRRFSFASSIFLSIASIVLVIFFSFNYGIDFIGGISLEARANSLPKISSIREVLNTLNIGEVVLQNFSENDISIKAGVRDEVSLVKNVDLIKTALNKHFPEVFEYRKVDIVGPQIGVQLIKSGVFSMICAFIAIMIYIWIRFEWYFGLGVLVALVHDVVLGLGFMSITRLDFNLSTIAALLTIIGYSVNDSVVIYDRVRENLRKFSKKPLYDIINVSINETLSRTTLTVFTTLLANLALIIFGGEAVRSFSILMFFGILVGTYSSIFISAPIICLFKVKQ